MSAYLLQLEIKSWKYILNATGMVVALCICRYLETKTLKEVKIHGFQPWYFEDSSRFITHTPWPPQQCSELNLHGQFRAGKYILGLPAAHEVHSESTRLQDNAATPPLLGSAAAAKNKTDLWDLNHCEDLYSVTSPMPWIALVITLASTAFSEYFTLLCQLFLRRYIILDEFLD